MVPVPVKSAKNAPCANLPVRPYVLLFKQREEQVVWFSAELPIKLRKPLITICGYLNEI